MSHVFKAMIVSTIVCVAMANVVGTMMARIVAHQSRKSYWPPAANSQLARDYRSLYGADRNYLGYCFFNLASVFGLVACAFYAALAL
jgi:hypothetical protein